MIPRGTKELEDQGTTGMFWGGGGFQKKGKEDYRESNYRDMVGF